MKEKTTIFLLSFIEEKPKSRGTREKKPIIHKLNLGKERVSNRAEKKGAAKLTRFLTFVSR